MVDGHNKCCKFIIAQNYTEVNFTHFLFSANIFWIATSKEKVDVMEVTVLYLSLPTRGIAFFVAKPRKFSIKMWLVILEIL